MLYRWRTYKYAAGVRRSRVNVGTGGARLQKGCTGAMAYATAYATRPMQAIGMSAAAHLVVD